MRGKMLVFWCSVLLVVLSLVAGGAVTAAPRPRIPYWVMADVVRGSSGAVGPVGAQTNVFKQGEEVVFRARVLDIATGQDPGLQGKGLKVLQDLGLKVTAYLDDGQSFPMAYGQHPAQAQGREGAAWFWSASWRIPAAYTAPHDGAELSIGVAALNLPKDSRWVKWWVIVTDKAGASVRFNSLGANTLLPADHIIIQKR